MEIEFREFSGNLLILYERLIRLLAEVYRDTEGKYPAMEWLKPEEKPDPNSPSLLKDFEDKYGGFLRWRLEEEIDELTVATNGEEVVGCVGLNYKLEKKNVPWIPEEFKNEEYGFIEMLVVHPEWQGLGLGKLLFERAINKLKKLGKRGCVVTFPNLDAISFYESFGGVKTKEYGPYVLYCF